MQQMDKQSKAVDFAGTLKRSLPLLVNAPITDEQRVNSKLCTSAYRSLFTTRKLNICTDRFTQKLGDVLIHLIANMTDKTIVQFLSKCSLYVKYIYT